MTPIWQVTEEKIRKAVRRIVRLARPRMIVLFGSAVRGRLTSHSDVDLLVVTATSNARKESVRIRRALRDIVMPMDILVISEEKLRNISARPGLVHGEALRTGKIMYESAA